MKTACLLLLLLMAAMFYILRSRKRFTRSTFGAQDLIDLAPNVRHIIRLAEQVAPTLQETSMIQIELRDLWTLQQNSRVLVCSVDHARMLCDDDDNQYELLHADMLNAHARTLRLLRRATVERAANVLSSRSVQLYASAAVLAYADEIIIVSNLLELEGDARLKTLEGHC